MTGAQRLGCDHEFAPRQCQRRRPRHPHESGDAEHAQNAGQVEQGLPEDRRSRPAPGSAAETPAAYPCCQPPASRSGRENSRRECRARRRWSARSPARRGRRSSDIRAPWISRDSTSRPRLSVPSQCSADIGARRSSMSMSNGFGNGNRSQTQRQKRKSSRRPPSRTAPPAERPPDGADATPGRWPSSSVAMTNPGIEDGKHVDDEVDQHVAKRPRSAPRPAG